jgi:POT family proton-dependent oligopeptide transporter
LKPNISAIVGDLYPGDTGARRDAGFSIFYMGINTGSFFGQIVAGYLGEQVEWHVGMGAAGVAMLLGLTVYGLTARKTLGEIGVQPTRHPDPAVAAKQQRTVKLVVLGFVLAVAAIFTLAATGAVTIDAQSIGKGMTFVLVGMAAVFFAFVYATGKLTGNEKKRIAVIIVLFVFAAIFWSAFEPAPTSLNLFAKDFTQRQMGGFEVPATWFQSINPLVIILCAPMFAALWVGLARRRGRDLSSPTKFALGLGITGLGFLVMIFAAKEVLASNGALKVSFWWLTISYFFQSIGELCISPVGLSSMTKLSPRKYVGQMMGIWFLASAVGNLIGGLVGGHVDPEKLDQMPGLFSSTTISLFVAAAILAAMIVPIRRMMESQTAE